VLADGEVKINLFGPDGAPLMIWAEGMNRSEVRRAMNIVTDNKLFLMSRWEDIRGRYD
jgi:hypothetical protein